MPAEDNNAPTRALRRLQTIVKRASVDFGNEERIQEICEDLVISDDKLTEIMRVFEESLDKGLQKEPSGTLKMLPSFVRAIPNGSELGEFLALDLGGTNFRVLLVRLRGEDTSISGHFYRIPYQVMRGTGEQLFDHIAECLAQFVEDQGLQDIHEIPLGFTFSFPCRQTALDRGTLITWTKGFDAAGVEGNDVVSMLNDAIERRGANCLHDTIRDPLQNLRVHVVALVNDTIGTLMSAALEDNDCQIGLIVGTGTNACYMEKLSRCPKLDSFLAQPDGSPDEMIINTEWCAFGDEGELDFIRTDWDKEVDGESINASQQIFEKMVSGMYLGEVVRAVLRDLTKVGLLFEGQLCDCLLTPGEFPTKFLSEIESDMQEDDWTFEKTQGILNDLGLESVSHTDCANVAYVCSLVSGRAAHLCAAGVAVLLRRIDRPSVAVAVDGSVYELHPTFKSVLERKTRHLLGSLPNQFKLMRAEDGSGKGAALVAAVAQRIESEHKLKRERRNQLHKLGHQPKIEE